MQTFNNSSADVIWHCFAVENLTFDLANKRGN